ncbi:hypothetical protein OpiT1DRAFT_02883 [Opitutaceae bacterium TAV1]|nr:hypothetical protein OpiT1DRAFT_02883 [Opitutaceae bacterium TAV1]
MLHEKFRIADTFPPRPVFRPRATHLGLTGREATRRALARWQWRIEQAAGALLIVLGVAMAFSS